MSIVKLLPRNDGSGGDCKIENDEGCESCSGGACVVVNTCSFSGIIRPDAQEYFQLPFGGDFRE